MLQAAAGALLANNEGVPLDRRIARTFGLDEISLRGTGEATDRVVAVGKRLSDRLYISYEQGLGATASQLVKLDFSLTQRLALRTETGTPNGGGPPYPFSWDWRGRAVNSARCRPQGIMPSSAPAPSFARCRTRP